MVSIAIKTSQ